MVKRIKEKLSKKVYNIFVDRICYAELKLGERIPSVRDIAKEIGVSTVTIVEAFQMLSDDGLIESFVGKGTFVVEELPHKFTIKARVVEDVAGETLKNMKQIYFFFNGLADTEINSRFYMKLSHAMQQDCQSRGIQIKTCDIHDDDALKEVYANKEDLIGVVYMLEPDHESRPKFEDSDINQVAFGVDDKDLYVNYVQPDNYRGGWQAAEYLHNKGYDELMFLSGFSCEGLYRDRHFRDRFRGIKDYCEFNKLPTPELLKWHCSYDGGVEDFDTIAKEIKLSKGKFSKGIIVGNVAMVDEVYVYSKFKHDIVNLYDAVDIITYGDGRTLVHLGLPVLRPSPEDMGYEIVSLLCRLDKYGNDFGTKRVMTGMILDEL